MRLARQIIAAITILLITLYFVDLVGFLPSALKLGILTEIQVLPAILTGFIWAIVSIALLTFIFGRLYCSTICPLGVFQDLIIRLSKNKLRQHKHRMHKKAHNTLRYIILITTILSLILGSSVIALWLDPYSIFGRLVSNLLSPIITIINNVLAHFSSASGSYAFSHQDIHWGNTITISSSVLFLAIIIYLNIKHQRLWCNTLCPVGTFLGLISKHAWLKVKINQQACISCNACARNCKSNCIDEKNKYQIDYSRCVMCFDCINSCKAKAISFQPTNVKNHGK